MAKKVLVYGWYHQGNIGDDLFISAYQHLFPQLDLVFSEQIEADQLQEVDAVFFGGGSFLLDHPNIAPDAIPLLKTKKIFYLGVGVEDNIHPLHLQLMSMALLLAIRSPEKLERVKQINNNTIVIPDLVYCLQSQIVPTDRISKSVLVIPNIVVVPQVHSPFWMHASWRYFKSEFSQFLDSLMDYGYEPHFWSLCHATKQEDDWAAAEIIGHSSYRHRGLLVSHVPNNFSEIANFVSRYQLVITQRFHGIVLSEMTRTPYIAIHHHDKLKNSHPANGKFVSYYNLSKHSLLQTFSDASSMNYSSILPIEQDIFEDLVQEVNRLL